VECWRQLAVREPLSGRFAVGYINALAARGDRAEALSFARQHEALVRRELEADPDPEVQRLEAELRTTSARTPPRSQAVSSAATTDHVEQTLTDDTGTTATIARTAIQEPAPWEIASPAPKISTAARPRRLLAGAAIVTIVVTGVGAFASQRGWLTRDTRPVLAVGLIREDNDASSARTSGVLTDMLATNLARVEGLAVLSNSRLLEIMQPARDSSVGYANAARRAGASACDRCRSCLAAPGARALCWAPTNLDRLGTRR